MLAGNGHLRTLSRLPSQLMLVHEGHLRRLLRLPSQLIIVGEGHLRMLPRLPLTGRNEGEALIHAQRLTAMTRCVQ